MPLEAKETLLREIEQLRRELHAREAALEAFNRINIDRGEGSQKYIGMRPIVAIRAYLEEVGERSEAQIIEALTAGGNMIGKTRKGSLEFSIQKNLELGNLVKHRNGLIGLPK